MNKKLMMLYLFMLGVVNTGIHAQTTPEKGDLEEKTTKVENPIILSAEAITMDKWITRGLEFSDVRVYQGILNVTKGPLTAGALINDHTGKRKVDEIDYFINYTVPLSSTITATATAVYIKLYSELNHSKELALTFTHSDPLNTSIILAKDFHHGKGEYLGIAINPSRSFGPVTVSARVEAGILNNKYWSNASGPSHIEGTARVEYKPTDNITIAGYVITTQPLNNLHNIAKNTIAGGSIKYVFTSNF